MLIPVTAVSPRSPPAMRVPPLTSIVVSACTASLPALMDVVPPENETASLLDLIPSPSASTVSVPSLTVIELFALIPSVLSVELSVVTLITPPFILISLLQDTAVCVLAVILRTPSPFSPPLKVISSLASITALSR